MPARHYPYAITRVPGENKEPYQYSGTMSRTIRRKRILWKHEHKEARKNQRRSYRYRTKIALRKKQEPEKDPPRTEGRITW